MDIYSESVHGSDTDELVIKTAAWDDDEMSVKYAWPDKNGHRARGGEFPLSAFPQIFEMLLREGYIEFSGNIEVKIK